MSAERPLVYTEVETHRANLHERVAVVRLMWRVAGEDDIAPKTRRKIRRSTLRTYLRPSARVSTYIFSGGSR